MLALFIAKLHWRLSLCAGHVFLVTSPTTTIIIEVANWVDKNEHPFVFDGVPSVSVSIARSLNFLIVLRCRKSVSFALSCTTSFVLELDAHSTLEVQMDRLAIAQSHIRYLKFY